MNCSCPYCILKQNKIDYKQDEKEVIERAVSILFHPFKPSINTDEWEENEEYNPLVASYSGGWY